MAIENHKQEIFCVIVCARDIRRKIINDGVVWRPYACSCFDSTLCKRQGLWRASLKQRACLQVSAWPSKDWVCTGVSISFQVRRGFDQLSLPRRHPKERYLEHPRVSALMSSLSSFLSFLFLLSCVVNLLVLVLLAAVCTSSSSPYSASFCDALALVSYCPSSSGTPLACFISSFASSLDSAAAAVLTHAGRRAFISGFSCQQVTLERQELVFKHSLHILQSVARPLKQDSCLMEWLCASPSQPSPPSISALDGPWNICFCITEPEMDPLHLSALLVKIGPEKTSSSHKNRGDEMMNSTMLTQVDE